MSINISQKLTNKTSALTLLPVVIISLGFLFFAYKFQLLPKTSNGPQVISDTKNKNEVVRGEPEVLEEEIVWGEPEVWNFTEEDTKDWKTYTSPNLGFSFKYPPKDWYPKDEKQNWGYNVLITAPIDVYTGQTYYEGQELVVAVRRLNKDGEELEDHSTESLVRMAETSLSGGCYYCDPKRAKAVLFKTTVGEGVYIEQRNDKFMDIGYFTQKNSYAVHFEVFRGLPDVESEKLFDYYRTYVRMLASTLE